MPTSRFRNPTTGKVISFEHSEGISQSELQNLAKVQYINALNEEDNFAVDVVKGIGAGAVKALIDAGAGVQSSVAQVIEASGQTDEENRFINALFSNAEYLRKVSNEFDETIGLDQDFANSFGGELAYGFGQIPVQLVTTAAGAVGGAAVGGVVGGPPGAVVGGAIGALGVGGGFAAAQMQTEAVRDAETTLGKSYSEFTDEEKRQTAMSSLAYMTIGGALEYFAVTKVVPKSVKSKLRRFVTGKESLPSGEVKQVFKSLKREAAESTLFEGMTETAEGQLLDTLASATYDDDRELISMNVLARRFNEFAVGAIVGGGTTTVIGTAERITGGKPLTKPKETPVQDQASISGKKKFKVTYQRQAADGTKSEINTIILANSQEEAQAEANKLLESDRSVVSQTLTVQGETEAAPGLVPKPDRYKVNVKIEEEDYILPDVDFDDIARLDVGQLSNEELQALIDSYNAYNAEGNRVRNLDEMQRSAEELAKESGMSESETQASIDEKNREFNQQRKRIARAIKERDARARGEVSQLSEADFDALAEEAQRKRRKKPKEIDYTNAEVGDTIDIVGVDGKRSQVEVIGISKSGSIKFKREDGSTGIVGSEGDSVLEDINSPDYVLQASGHGFKGRSIKDLSDAELDSLERILKDKIRKTPSLRSTSDGAGRAHQADLFAIQLERKRRARAPEGPTPTPTPAPTAPPTEQPAILTEEDFEDPLTVGAAGPETRQLQFNDDEALNALPSKEKARYNRHIQEPIQRGAVRLNLNSKFNKEGVQGPLFVQTLHPIKKSGSPEYGNAHSYSKAFTLKNATFSVNPFAKTIIRSKAENKYPMASVDGDIVNTEPSLEGEVLSFNPFRDDSFVDSQGRVVIGADEVTVYGTKAYARGNIRYAEESPEVVTASEILELNKSGKKYKHPKFHPRGISVNLDEDQVQKLEALAASEGEPDVVAEAGKQTVSYDLLDSPYINDYDGKEAEDKTLPDYDSLHYLVSEPNRQAINEAIESGAVDQLADDIAEEASEMMEDPQIAAGIGWYSRMRVRLQEIFGADTELFTHLLGTTSAQTAVELNFRYSVDLYNRFKAGEFDSKIKKYLELRGRMQAGTLGDLLIRIGATNSKGVKYTKDLVKKSQPSALLQSAARHYDLLPKQKSGDLYGANSYPALKALSEVWFEDRIGPNRMTPKTPQFAMNLNGQSMEATIDLWAARLLHRKIHGGQTRILPSEETAVENGDFALGQIVFRRAGKKLGMNPDDLQALVWFGEKQIWDQNGWTGAAGALKSSFDEPAAVFYPETGTRSEEDANLILDFIAAERLVKRDIDFPNAVQPATQANNRKAYDEYLRSSVISDYIQSTGRRTVYEGRSVESDRKRQVTRSINRLRGYGGSVSYRKGQGKEPKRSLKVVERSDYLDSKEGRTASEVFSETAARNKKANRFGSSVDVLKAADYNNHDIIVTSSKKGEYATLSISPDGEITSVTKSKGATKLDVSAAFDMAISTGKVKYLNGFETILPDIYANYGFTPVARLKFDPQFKPPGWSYSTYKEFNKGKPDVIFMRFDGTMGSVYDPTGFPAVQSYEDGIEAARAEVTAPADVTAQNLLGDRTIESPEGGFSSIKEMEEFIRDTFKAIASKIGVDIEPSYAIFGEAQYNVTKGIIQYNPRNLFTARTKDGIRAAMREEIIHASMHRVLMQRSPSKSRNNSWLDFMSKLGKDLTAEQRAAISSVYSNLTTDDQFGAEYSRAAVQYALYGDVTEQYVVGGKSWETIKSVFKSIQSFLAKKLGKDVENREVAEVIRDSVALVRNTDPSARVTNQSVVEIAQGVSSGLPGMSSENISDPYIEPFEAREKKKKRKKIIRTFKKYLQPASEFFAGINPDIAFHLSKYLTGMESAQYRAVAMVRNFQNGIAGIQNEADRSELGRLLSYSPEPQQIAEGEHKENIRRRDELLIKYDLYNSFQLQVRPMLDQLYQEAKAAGLDINYLTEYFPRLIKDFEGLMKLYGKDVQNDFNAYIEQENERRQARGEKPITEAEKPIEFEIYLNQKKFVNPSRIPANIKERRSNIITKKAERFYYEPEVALGSYINNMIVAIETQKLLGTATRTKMKPSVIDGEAIKTFDLSDGSGSLSRLITKLLAEGKLSEDQMSNLEWGLVQFFNPKSSSELDIFELGRTLSYGTLLVDPTSTLSQMYDLAFNMMDNGVLPALSAMVGGDKVRMRDLGLDPDRLAADYPATTAGKKQYLNDLVRKGLSLTGFRRMDQLMKETNLTANYRRFQRIAKMSPNSGAFKKFRTELEFLVGSDADIVINDLKSGKEDSPYVRELLVRKLLETQPLNRFEMPLGVSSNPNTRMLYTMKSFMVKQMSLVVRKYGSVLFGRESTVRQRAEAAKDLIRLLILFQIVGLPVDFLKDLLAGRDVYPGDYSTNALLRIAGMSKYTIYQAEKEGIGGALESYFMPVGVQQTFDMATDIGRIMTDISYIPDAKAVGYLPFSDLWYYRFGPGAEKQKKKRIRKRREGVTPFLEGL